jgi:transcription-repair coupling factor (superfamily II helicase)
VAERLMIYQNLDNSKNATDLDIFRSNMEDRFGPIPAVVHELIKSIELRWMAKEIGFEKLVIKSNKMIGYFVAQQDSPYYQSSHFTKVLNFIQTNPQDAKMNERNNKLRLIFDDVKSISKSIANLERI